MDSQRQTPDSSCVVSSYKTDKARQLEFQQLSDLNVHGETSQFSDPLDKKADEILSKPVEEPASRPSFAKKQQPAEIQNSSCHDKPETKVSIAEITPPNHKDSAASQVPEKKQEASAAPKQKGGWGWFGWGDKQKKETPFSVTTV